MWDPQVAEFEEQYRVVRYDLRGHGRSAAPDTPYTGYGDLLALLDDLEIVKATIIGLSAGAELAVDFAIAYPQRVRRLVLASPGLGGYRIPPLPWAQPVFEAAGAGEPMRAAQLWAETPIMTLRTTLEGAGKVRGLVQENWKLWTYRRTEQRLDPPAIDRLAEIACPVLVVVGEEDLPHIIEVAELIAAGAQDVERVTIPGAGHLVNLDTPDRFNDIVAEFLRGR
jgi:3-oxoadipate enol-lactonase